MSYTLAILRDETPCNPRIEFDNLGTMVCFHKRYSLGDSKSGYSLEDYSSWGQFEAALGKEHPVVLPLYLYDHSGMTISTTPFSCPWDSGQVGFIYMDKTSFMSEFNSLEQAKAFLEAEVEEYNQYLTGDVWGYEVTDEDGEDVDACWGFYGKEEAEQAGQYMLNLRSEQAPKQTDWLEEAS